MTDSLWWIGQSVDAKLVGGPGQSIVAPEVRGGKRKRGCRLARIPSPPLRFEPVRVGALLEAGEITGILRP
jgi:hypothetical protein